MQYQSGIVIWEDTCGHQAYFVCEGTVPAIRETLT